VHCWYLCNKLCGVTFHRRNLYWLLLVNITVMLNQKCESVRVNTQFGKLRIAIQLAAHSTGAPLLYNRLNPVMFFLVLSIVEASYNMATSHFSNLCC